MPGNIAELQTGGYRSMRPSAYSPSTVRRKTCGNRAGRAEGCGEIRADRREGWIVRGGTAAAYPDWSLNPTCQWEPSQNGLFFDAPQRHSA